MRVKDERGLPMHAADFFFPSSRALLIYSTFEGSRHNVPHSSTQSNFQKCGAIPHFPLSPSEGFPRQTGEMSRTRQKGRAARKRSGFCPFRGQNSREDCRFFTLSQYSSSSRASLACPIFIRHPEPRFLALLPRDPGAPAPHFHHNLTSQTAKPRAALL